MSVHFPSVPVLFDDVRLRIEDLEVRFLLSLPTCIRGKYLRQVRRIVPLFALFTTLFFSLYFTLPRPVPSQAVEPTSSWLDVYTETGIATWYGGWEDGFAGRQTANGEALDPKQATCAHRTLPFGSYVEVENLDNGRLAVLRVNDRGPFLKGRILDVSLQGAHTLGLITSGKALVRIRTIDPIAPDLAFSEFSPFTVPLASLRGLVSTERLTRKFQNTLNWINLQDITNRQSNSIKRICADSFISFEEAIKTADQIGKRFRDRSVDPFITCLR